MSSSGAARSVARDARGAGPGGCHKPRQLRCPIRRPRTWPRSRTPGVGRARSGTAGKRRRNKHPLALRHDSFFPSRAANRKVTYAAQSGSARFTSTALPTRAKSSSLQLFRTDLCSTPSAKMGSSRAIWHAETGTAHRLGKMEKSFLPDDAVGDPSVTEREAATLRRVDPAAGTPDGDSDRLLRSVYRSTQLGSRRSGAAGFDKRVPVRLSVRRGTLLVDRRIFDGLSSGAQTKAKCATAGVARSTTAEPGQARWRWPPQTFDSLDFTDMSGACSMSPRPSSTIHDVGMGASP